MGRPAPGKCLLQLSLNYYSLPAVKQNPTPEFEGVKATMPPILQPLTSVPLGGKATVVEIKLPPESRPRLMEMGLLVGTVMIVAALTVLVRLRTLTFAAMTANVDGVVKVLTNFYSTPLLVGTSVELVRFAPLGDPVEIKVRGYHLTLRRHEAEQILVQPNG